MSIVYEPKDVRPMKNWVCVLAQPRKTKLASGLLLAPNETGLEKVSQSTGHIIRVGAGDKCAALELKAGDRVLYRGFLKHANPLPTEEKWEDGQPKVYFLMSVDDLLAVIPEDMDADVFSSSQSEGN